MHAAITWRSTLKADDRGRRCSLKWLPLWYFTFGAEYKSILRWKGRYHIFDVSHTYISQTYLLEQSPTRIGVSLLGVPGRGQPRSHKCWKGCEDVRAVRFLSRGQMRSWCNYPIWQPLCLTFLDERVRGMRLDSFTRCNTDNSNYTSKKKPKDSTVEFD